VDHTCAGHRPVSKYYRSDLPRLERVDHQCTGLCVYREHRFPGRQVPGLLVASVVKPTAIEVLLDLAGAGAQAEGLVDYILSILDRLFTVRL